MTTIRIRPQHDRRKPPRLRYTRDELLADPPFVTRIERDGVLLHGGYDAEGRYLPPRSTFRVPAIAAWSEQLASAGAPSRVIEPDAVDRAFVPNTEQAKMLLRNGATGAMTRILTLIGVVEGFGNDGIKLIPEMDLQEFVVEPLDETCLGHLFDGLLEAHGNDEAGRGDEAGHDQMWFAVRNAALADPPVTLDMFENLPIAPPPGYQGPAKPAPEAITVGGMLDGLREDVAPELQLLVRAMVQILVIELLAYHTFAWASEVLGDPTCSADAEFARATIDHIRTDEDIHVGYLQCGLAELATLTVRTTDGGTIAGADLVDAACRSALANQTGARFDRILEYRLAQVRAELAAHSDGERLTAEFDALATQPAEALR
ncbi:hypothetical protein PO878_17365 [Iamia majanohamensis]|uniref:Ferritin-like protein n=1 Tax=Iamia majanohamensis TaxID=467976 RepID=A0AAE9Y887_9ACTN|nr:hypothetical protein [Iamia majanohamensis]WCO66273.1 hypothetical protein PO878_17365 [Iamia majanohamensis]